MIKSFPIKAFKNLILSIFRTLPLLLVLIPFAFGVSVFIEKGSYTGDKKNMPDTDLVGEYVKEPYINVVRRSAWLSSVSATLIKHRDEAYKYAFYVYLAAVFFSWFSFITKHIVDRWAKKFIKFIFRRFPIFSEEYYKLLTNSTLASVSDLNIFIRNAFKISRGVIYLFNPSDELVDENNKEMRLTQKAIKDNAKNIQMLLVARKRDSLITLEKLKKVTGLSENCIELHDIDSISDNCMANNLRFAVYCKKSKKEGNICARFFLLRPISPPYADKTVIVHSDQDMSEVTYCNTIGADDGENILRNVNKMIASRI